MATVDLWPDSITEDVGLSGPTHILKEQALALAAKTKNIVKAEIDSGSAVHGIGASFADSFVLYGPIIGYRYELFRVFYTLDLYPVELVFDEWEKTRIFPDEEAFIAGLAEVFSNAKTLKVINAIRMLSKED